MTDRPYTCVVCDSRDIEIFIEIPQVPVYCNVLYSTREEALNAPRADMRLGFCKACGHIYNFAFDPDKLDYTLEYENSLHHSPRFQEYATSLATQLIDSHHNDLGQVHIVNVRNNGAVRDWPADWVLELPAKVDRSGLHPLPADPLPAACFGLIAPVKMYEILTVQAAVHGDRNAAYQALLTHPLGPSADRVEAVLEDLLQTNKQWLPQFFS